MDLPFSGGGQVKNKTQNPHRCLGHPKCYREECEQAIVMGEGDKLLCPT